MLLGHYQSEIKRTTSIYEEYKSVKFHSGSLLPPGVYSGLQFFFPRNGAAVGSSIRLSSDCSVCVERAETAFLWVFNEDIMSRVWCRFGVLKAFFSSTVHFPANVFLSPKTIKREVSRQHWTKCQTKNLPHSHLVQTIYGPSFLSVRLGDYLLQTPRRSIGPNTSGGIHS